MKWNVFTIHTTVSAADLVSDMLLELGVSGVEIRNVPAEDESAAAADGSAPADVIFYTETNADTKELLQQVKDGISGLRAFSDTGEGTVTLSETEDKDWVDNWKAYFHAFYVEDILIRPTWTEKPDDGIRPRFTVDIDPGTSFGSGSHETTKLCIRGLLKNVRPEDRVLDVGTGSGILGIVALKMGAGYVFGTDIEKEALASARENIAQNGYTEENFRVCYGDIISDPAVQEAAGYGQYDIVVANILADVIIPLQMVVTAQMKKGAKLVVSGIINSKEQAVLKALTENPELTVVSEDYEGEWVSFTAVKNS